MIQAHADLIRRHRLRLNKASEASALLGRSPKPAIDAATERALLEADRLDGDVTDLKARLVAMTGFHTEIGERLATKGDAR